MPPSTLLARSACAPSGRRRGGCSRRSTATFVASASDVLATKILALTEQDPNLRPVLEIARALREQVDWEFVRGCVEHTPFGAAVLTLVERLGVMQGEAAAVGTPVGR